MFVIIVTMLHITCSGVAYGLLSAYAQRENIIESSGSVFNNLSDLDLRICEEEYSNCKAALILLVPSMFGLPSLIAVCIVVGINFKKMKFSFGEKPSYGNKWFMSTLFSRLAITNNDGQFIRSIWTNGNGNFL